MGNTVSNLPLDKAIEQALVLGGAQTLHDSHRLSSYVMDLVDKTKPEARLFLGQVDERLIEPLAEISVNSGEAVLRTAISRIEQTLVQERFVNLGLAQRTSREVVKGVASFWHIPCSYDVFAMPHPTPGQQGSGSEGQPGVPRQNGWQANATSQQAAWQQPMQTPAQQPMQAPQVSAQQQPAMQTPQAPVQQQPMQVPPQAPTQQPPKKNAGLKVILAILLVAAVGAGAFVFWQHMQGPSPTSDTNRERLALPAVTLPTISQTQDIRTLSQTENELEQHWYLFSDKTNGTTSVLYLKNLSKSYKDVDLTFQFFDSSDKVASTNNVLVLSLAPNETTCVYSSGDAGTVDSTYYYTISDARNKNAISLGECLRSHVVSSDNKEIVVSITNDGSTDAHVYSVYAFGANSQNAAQWAKSTWTDENGNETAQTIKPGESIKVSFKGDSWDQVTPSFFPIGYADP